MEITGFIYTVRSKSRLDLVYYGSTEQKLCERMSSHRSSYKRFVSGKINNPCTSFQIMALGDAYIELVEEVRVPSKKHMHAIEGRYQRENDCVNKIIAGRTAKELRDDPKTRAHHAAYRGTPEYKANYDAWRKSPEQIARRRAVRATPEAKAIAAALRSTPEAKAKDAANHARIRALKKSVSN